MKASERIIVGLFVLLMLSPAWGQYTREDKGFRRWLTKKPVIDSIVVEGNNYFSDSKIKNSLFSRTDNIFRAIKGDRRRRVQRETLLRDTSDIKFLYLSSGFLGVRIAETFEPVLPDSNALVRVRIEEGRQFMYGQINIVGDYPSGFENNIYKITRKFKNDKPVDPFKLRQALYDIKSVFANNGYPYAAAEYVLDTLPDRNVADVTMKIRSDSLVHFGDVSIVGAESFDTSLVRREVTFNRGDLYRRKDIIKSQERLLNTGYYLTLRLNSMVRDTSSLMERLNPDFTLTLREKEPHYVSVKTGASQDSLKDLIWNFSASWGKRNMFGSRWLEITARSSFVIFTEWRLMEHNYRIRMTEPWFLGIRMPLTLTGQYSPGVRSLLQPYRKQTYLISATTTRTIRDKVKIHTGFQYESVNIYGVSKEAEIEIKQEEGISIRRKFYINVTRDSRPNLFIPDDGSVTSLRFESIGGFLGGDDSFYLLEGSWSRYQRVWPGWISASRIKCGYVQETGDATSVPADDRYYIGGANTIRGFSERDLGPRSEKGNPTGADIIVIVNQEFRYPILGKFWGSIFTDIGNGYRYRADIKFDNLAVSYGLGLQFISPAGPIRLDYARRVRVKNIEPGYKFHFTILYAF